MRTTQCKRALAIAAAVAATSIAIEARAGFIQSAGGTYDFNSSTNWENGIIDGLWGSNLALTGDQTLTFGEDTALSSGLTFLYSGSRTITLRGTGGDRTLTLGGDVLHRSVSNTTIVFGSTSNNQRLFVDLGGEARKFTIIGEGNGGDFGRSIILTNDVFNGGLIVDGGNTGGGRLVLQGANNSLNSLQLNGAEFRVEGNSNAATDTAVNVSGAFHVAPGNGVLTLVAHADRSTQLVADSFSRNRGTLLVRGTNLGSTGANSTQVIFNTAPTVANGGLIGGDGSNGTDLAIMPGVFGTMNTGTGGSSFGFRPEGGFVTYGANGIRLLEAHEYKTSITSGQTQLDNVKLTNDSGTPLAVDLDADTTINSLYMHTSATSSAITISGSKLSVNSGMIYASSVAPAADTTSQMTLASEIDFGGREGIILFQTNGTSNGEGGARLYITGPITNTDQGVTFAGRGLVEIGGAGVNTYTGETVIDGANVRLAKSVQNSAIVDTIVLNSGVLQNTGNQIADDVDIIINGGSYLQKAGATNSGSGTSETFRDLYMNGGSYTDGATGTSSGTTNLQNAYLAGGNWSITGGHKTNISGSLNLSGGTVAIERAHNAGNRTVVTVTGDIQITNTASGAYTAISLNPSNVVDGFAAEFVMKGDLRFVGNSTNNQTARIAAPAGVGPYGYIRLDGDRTFDIGDGAADQDLLVEAVLTDGASTTGSLIKTGPGTLVLGNANTYTGNTTINQGVLALGPDGSIASSPRIEITAGASLDTTAQDFAFAAGQVLVIGLDATGAGSAGLLNAAVLDISEAALEFTFTGALDDGAYVIASYSSLVGTFASVDAPAGYSVDYNYNGGNQIAIVVPEPGTAALLGVVVGAFVMRRRRD